MQEHGVEARVLLINIFFIRPMELANARKYSTHPDVRSDRNRNRAYTGSGKFGYSTWMEGMHACGGEWSWYEPLRRMLRVCEKKQGADDHPRNALVRN